MLSHFAMVFFRFFSSHLFVSSLNFKFCKGLGHNLQIISHQDLVAVLKRLKISDWRAIRAEDLARLSNPKKGAMVSVRHDMSVTDVMMTMTL